MNCNMGRISSGGRRGFLNMSESACGPDVMTVDSGCYGMLGENYEIRNMVPALQTYQPVTYLGYESQ
jgi:hypothetical protein